MEITLDFSWFLDRHSLEYEWLHKTFLLGRKLILNFFVLIHFQWLQITKKNIKLVLNIEYSYLIWPNTFQIFSTKVFYNYVSKTVIFRKVGPWKFASLETGSDKIIYWLGRFLLCQKRVSFYLLIKVQKATSYGFFYIIERREKKNLPIQ